MPVTKLTPFLRCAFIFLIILSQITHADASRPDLAGIKFTEHAASFLKGIAAEKNSHDKGLVTYTLANASACTYAGLVMDKGLEIGAVNDIIAYYDIQTSFTATTNQVLKHLLATYKAPTIKLRDDGDTRAYYWITPSLFIRFMSGEATHKGKKEIYSLVQVGNIKAITPYPDADITNVYNFVVHRNDPTTAQAQPVITNAPQKIKAVNSKKPSYHVFFTNSACRFMVLINDVPAVTITDAGSVSSEVPINHLILRSGLQTLTCVLLPVKGQTTLNKDASLKVKITKTADDAPEQEEVAVADFEPVKTLKTGQTELRKSFQFKAEVPYTLAGWQGGIDLTHLSSAHAEVITAYQQIVELLKKRDYNAYEKLSALKLREMEKATYTTEADSHKEFQEVVSYLSRPGVVLRFDSKTAQIKFYGGGKLVTLVQPNLDPALHAVNTRQGEDYQVPLIFYKKSVGEPLSLIR